MKLVWTAIVVVVALAMGAVVAVTVFPDRIGGYLPGWLQPQQVGGGPQVVLELEPDGVELAQGLEDSVRIIERRLNDLGARSLLRIQDNRIVVELPRSVNVNHAIEVATRRGKLQLRLVDQTMTPEQAMREGAPVGSEVLYGRSDKTPYLVEKRVILSGRDLVDAQAAFDQRTNEPVITFKFNTAGTRRFAQVTQENVGRPFAIVIDNAVVSAPVIREPILGGSGQISGSFTAQEANDLAILLRAGELPGRLKVIEIKPPAP